MIDVLLSGRLRGTPSLRTATSGATFVVFRMAAADRHGDSVLCSCMSFAPAVQTAVCALADGDGLAVSGEAALSSWQGQDGPRQGLDVQVHELLTPYHLGRKRQAMEDGTQGRCTNGRRRG